MQLKDSTLEDQGLEACMVSVLRSLTVDDLPVRMSGNGSLNGAGPESRGLMGQEQVFLCFASPPCVFALGMLIGASFLTVQIYANMAQSSSIAKPWAAPMATVAPTVTTMPPAEMAESERERCKKIKEKCIEYCADTILDEGKHEPEFSRCLRACMEQNGCYYLQRTR